MVRTKAENSGRKASAKAPRKITTSAGGNGAGTSNGASPKAGKAAIGGGNPVCARPIPDWQKGIAGFMVKSANGESSSKLDIENIDPDAGPSSAMPKHAAVKENGNDVAENDAAAALKLTNGNGHVSDDEEQAEEEPVSASKKKKVSSKKTANISLSDEQEAGGSGAQRASQKGQKQPARKRKPAPAKETKKNGVIDSDSD